MIILNATILEALKKGKLIQKETKGLRVTSLWSEKKNNTGFFELRGDAVPGTYIANITSLALNKLTENSGKMNNVKVANINGNQCLLFNMTYQGVDLLGQVSEEKNINFLATLQEFELESSSEPGLTI